MIKTLVVSRFSQQSLAEQAAEELKRVGLAPADMSLFYVNPQGQHAIHPLGGDEDKSAGTHGAGSGAMRGAAGGAGAGTMLGAATIPVLGPAGPLLGAAVGAYTGALIGALNNMAERGGEPHQPAEDHGGSAPTAREPGMMLAVAVESPEQRAMVQSILEPRADQVEYDAGVLRSGEWADFDPLEGDHRPA